MSVKCGRCGELIDRGACGQAYTIYTIKDDRDNDPETKNQIRGYLCEVCTGSLELWLKHLEAPQ